LWIKKLKPTELKINIHIMGVLIMEIPGTNIEIKDFIYCVNGKYEIYAHPSNDIKIIQRVQQLGLESIGHNNWSILKCNSCGNIQFSVQI
jgi:hypothetical protein